MRKFNLRQVVSRMGVLAALSLTALVTSTPAAVGQTILINPLLEGGFELGPSFAANGWTVANGSVTNQWYVGTVPSGFTNNAAYISADAGVTNSYNNSSSVVHFYRDVTFPAGETAIALNFNWKALGEAGYYDALIVSVAPTSYTPTASATSLGTSSLGAPAIEIGRLWNSSTTQSAYLNIPASVVGNCSGASTMRLIFTWKNDGSGGAPPSCAIDNIALGSSPNPITSLGGTFTIDNTLPQSATNFPSFSAAIVALNGAYSCAPFTGPIVFNVTAGQTFNELPPAITASGNSTATITFQKSGAGSNPVITSLQSLNVNDATIALLGGDYFTFDGIDLNASANVNMEYGYLIRNASATDGAKNNTIKNSTVQLNRTGIINTSSSGVMISATTTANGFAVTNATGSNDNNLLQNITVNGAINGISILGTSGFADLNNAVSTTAGIRNTITNIGPVGATSMVSRGIYLTNQSGATVQNSDVSNVTSYTSTAQGIFLTGAIGNSTIARNSVYAISNQGSTSTTSVAYGIQAQNSTTGTNNIRISNNMVGNIFTSFTGTATATRYAIGIHTGVASATSSQSYDVYHNTVSIGNGLTPTYSNTCYEIQNVAAVYRVQNNIFANFTGAQGATARHYAWVTTSATNFGAAGSVSNYNDLYIATDAGTSGFVARANTTNLTTIANWTAAITAVPGTDLNSISSAPVFVNNNSNLHLNFGVTPTQIESSGNNALGITIDFDGDSRPGPAGSVNGGGTAPDMGADEFDGSPLSAPTITLNSVTPPTTAQCTATARLVSVNVANTSGTVTSVSLGYTVNGVPQTPIVMVNTSGTTWEATIPVPTPANATITWGVSATNSFALNGSYIGTAYADEPLFGTTASASASNTTVCSGNPTNLSAEVSRIGVAAIGAGSLVTSGSGGSGGNYVSPFSHYFGGYKAQYVIRASELTAAGFGAGNITSLAFDVTTAGITYNGFEMNIANTASTTANATFINGTFTTVYTGNLAVPSTGINTITFGTPFNWDGTSNILVQLCWSNNNTGGTAAEVKYDATSFTAMAYYRADSQTAATICGTTTATSTLSNRPRILLNGKLITPITSVTWMDGAATVGTGNPLAVNPTATTTYTANITAAGCPVTPSPTTTVTVNPLPSAPSASNSTQCGTQIPTASVASTSGLPTPTFIWYDAVSGGSVMQNGTSTTYTSNVASTTTFYVSELNTVTGCESARTAVTVTVAAADGISASASATTICIGNSVTLTAANTNPSPVQNYTYTWSGVANSGANPSVNGTSVTVTPTQPGTYQFDLSGVDGGCNAVANVSVTVDPFTATVAPINVTCNGYNNGSFSLSSSSCGTMPYTYSVDGGAFGAIPTNLTPGVHAVVVQDDNGYLVASQNITITEPSDVVNAPVGTGATICQNGTTAPISATSITSGITPLTASFGNNLISEGTTATTFNVTVPALPANANIVSTSLVLTNVQAINGSYRSEIRVELSGATTLAPTQISTLTSGGTISPNPVLTIPNLPLAGGAVTLSLTETYNDAGNDATFGNVSIVINYTLNNSITWWDASTSGTQVGTGSPFETIGTSVLPNANTPGTYTFYAQGENGGCSGVTRTPVTVTVNPTSSSTTTITACGSYMWTNGTTYTTSGTYTQTLTNSVGCDSVATLNLTINQPTTSTVSATACGSYTWAQNSTTYTTSGMYSVTLAGANSVGCDSTITLNLTINQPTTSTVSATACGSYTWAQNSTTYTTSGMYSVTLAGANSVGCDSTITLNLTINQPTTSTISVTACSSYTWADNATTYTTSGTYTATLAGANANGCDSTITLNLTINQPTTATVTASACESYTWMQNNMTYTASGMYNDTITNAAGCDSIITLDLTINMPTTATVTASACESYTWLQNNMTYTVSGMYNDTIMNAAGCDSIITLDLTINMPTMETVTASACESYTWTQNNMTYTVSGMYNDTIMNAAGCDSIITLDLTITGLPTATATDNGDATITASAGASYQWINCTTGQAIAGATAQTYTATANGDYAVVVTNAGGCSDTSTCVTIDYIGLKEITDASIRVFPNPTNNDVFVTMSATEATIEVSDAQGKLLQTTVVKNGEKVSLGAYETGVYFLRVRTANGSTLERIVKQ